MDPLHPRICITYSPPLETAARSLADKYRLLGAEVTVLCERNFKRIRAFKGSLCYFSKDRVTARIAKSLAKNVNTIQKTSARFLQVEKSRVDFMIYLVAKPLVEMSLPIVASNLRQCPLCPASVRADRLLRHRKKVHQIPVGKQKPPPISAPVAPRPRAKPLRYISSDAPVPMGTPGVLGWSSTLRIKKLKPRKGVPVCRLCGSVLSMYNSRECYSCNPK